MRNSDGRTLEMHDLSLEDRLMYLKQLHPESEWMQGILLKDEWANSLTHGIGLLLSIIGCILIVMIPLQEGDVWRLVSLSVYGASLVLLYAASTCYHAIRHPRLKKIFRTIDHCAIYLLIAGSYTPFTLLLLEGRWGWLLFSTIWLLAGLGIIFKIYYTHRFKVLSTFIYLFMGWLVLIALEPLVTHFHSSGLRWLIAGGLFYTGGVVFYVLDKRRFFHAIWHVCVMGGSACHYMAIFLYI